MENNMSKFGYLGFKDTNGDPHGFINNAGAPQICNQPYLQALAEGDIANHTPWSKIGYAAVPATTECDVWSACGVGSANYVIPLMAAEATRRILSNNAADVGTVIRGDATGNTVQSDAGGSLTTIVDADVDFTSGTAVAIGDCVILDPHGTVPEWGYVSGVAQHTLTIENGFSKLGTGASRYYAVVDYSNQAGCHAVYVSYLDATYTQRREIIVTNSGANGVLTINSNYYRINAFRVIATGANGKPTGTVAIMDNATPPTIIYSYITAGFTRARNSIYTVPTGKTLYITNFNLSFGANAANKAEYGRYYLRAAQYTSEDGVFIMRTNVTPGVVMWYPYAEVVVGNSVAPIELQCPVKIVSKTSIKVSGVASGAGVVTCGMRGWME
jgi:hypothetical protein